MDVTHLQVGGEIKVAGEYEKEPDSKEAETEVFKFQTYVLAFFLGALSSSNIWPIIPSFRFDVSSENKYKNSWKAHSKKNSGNFVRKVLAIFEIEENDARYIFC